MNVHLLFFLVLLFSYFFLFFFFFFNDTPTTEIYTLSLHDALPISSRIGFQSNDQIYLYYSGYDPSWSKYSVMTDRKSTRLNSSHRCISYAVFCLKKKKKK